MKTGEPGWRNLTSVAVHHESAFDIGERLPKNPRPHQEARRSAPPQAGSNTKRSHRYLILRSPAPAPLSLRPTMTIKAGDALPETTFTYIPWGPELEDAVRPSSPSPPAPTYAPQLACGHPQQLPTSAWAGKKVVLFAVPGAFTPTCHANHLPGYIKQYDALKAKGVDVVAVVAANDAFVMSGWARVSGLQDKVCPASCVDARGGVLTRGRSWRCRTRARSGPSSSGSSRTSRRRGSACARGATRSSSTTSSSSTPRCALPRLPSDCR
jgi:peroxiredoxin